MGVDTTVSLAFLFSILAALGAISAIRSNWKKNRDTEERKAIEIEKNFVKLDVKLDQLFNQIQSLSENEKRNTNELQRIDSSIARQDEQIKTLFDRVKKIEGGLMDDGK